MRQSWMSSKAETSMRPETKGTGWQAIPVHIGARRHRILNFGQFIRSLVFAAFGAAAVVMIALSPAHDRASGGAPHDSAVGQLTDGGMLHSPAMSAARSAAVEMAN